MQKLSDARILYIFIKLLWETNHSVPSENETVLRLDLCACGRNLHFFTYALPMSCTDWPRQCLPNSLRLADIASMVYACLTQELTDGLSSARSTCAVADGCKCAPVSSLLVSWPPWDVLPCLILQTADGCALTVSEFTSTRGVTLLDTYLRSCRWLWLHTCAITVSGLTSTRGINMIRMSVDIRARS